MKKPWMVAVVVILAAACGDSGDSVDNGTVTEGGGELSATEQELAEAIRDSILEDNDPDSPFGETEAMCVGNNAVREFGVEGLFELGVTVDNADPGDAFAGATDEQIDTIIDVTLACVDFAEAFVAEAAGEISNESARCLGDGLADTGLLRPLVRAQFRGEEGDFGDDPEALEQFFELITECLTAEELVGLADS